MKKEIKIGNCIIADEQPAFIIAEMSANHLGDYNRAVKIIDEVKRTGADAVKLQTYTPDTLTIDCDSEPFRLEGGLWKGNTLYTLFEQAFTPWEWQENLMKYANSIGLVCFSSPFDHTAVDFMESINMPAYKIASYEINDIPLIRKAARTGKPLIISTGIAYLGDIEAALQACREENNDNIILLKCTSAYPCPYEDMNIRVIPTMRDTFDCIMGLSDHTLGSEVALGAVALGAKVIEKHVTLKRSDGGVDSAFSMEIEEFKVMIEQVRNLEKALGRPEYKLSDKQIKERWSARSLYVVKDIERGALLSNENVRSIRPSGGLPPKYLDKLIGNKAAKDLKKGTPLNWNMIETDESLL